MNSTSSKYLHELSPCGTISVDGEYFADFAIPHFGDTIDSIFARIDKNYFLRAELYINSILYATMTTLPAGNELPFFVGTLYISAIQMSTFLIRVVFNKNCVDHAKLYVSGNLVSLKAYAFRADPEKGPKLIHIFIPKE